MSAPNAGDLYYIVSDGGVLCIDLKGPNPESGAPCILNRPRFQEVAPTREWILKPVGDGTWKIYNWTNNNYLTMKDSTSKDGVAVACVDNNETDLQSWLLEAQKKSGQVLSYVIRNKQNSKFVLDLPGFTEDQGAQLLAYTENGGWNQRWVFIPVSP